MFITTVGTSKKDKRERERDIRERDEKRERRDTYT
jgi:hypothetical protein